MDNCPICFILPLPTKKINAERRQYIILYIYFLFLLNSVVKTRVKYILLKVCLFIFYNIISFYISLVLSIHIKKKKNYILKSVLVNLFTFVHYKIS